MNFLTHILISRALYRTLSKKTTLDRRAFCYGNIKPDLSPECLRNPHILENYLFTVHNTASRLILQPPDAKEFSADLGVLCHYVCDFFCYCHLNDALYHKLFRHFIYEVRLHWALCLLPIKKRPNIKRSPAHADKTVAAMILELRKEYHTKQKTLRRDLDYAIAASLRACELILQCSQNETGGTTAAGSA